MRKFQCLECGPSLAKRYGVCSSILLTVSMLFAHTLFALGQFKDLYHYEVVYAFNGVTVLIDFDLLGQHKYNLTLPSGSGNVTIVGESYNSTLHDLWTYDAENAWLDGNPNFAYNANAPYILFWCLLILSGLWPHCKLIAVHLLWYLPANAKLRKRWLWWLDFFGKYSMTDVFAMLTMVAWAAVSMKTTTEDIVDTTLRNLPNFLANQTNTTFLVDEFCQKKWHNHTRICEKLFEFIIDHPHGLMKHLNFSDMGGTVDGALNVVTDEGLYFFSSAVWATLIISAVVNILAEHWKPEVENIETPMLLMVEPPPAKARSLMHRVGCCRRLFVGFMVVCWGLTVTGGLFLPMITRTIYGTLIELAQVPGLLTDEEVHESYSLLQTMDHVGDGGGNNPFLQKDLAAFTMIFPCLLVVMSAIVLFVPMRPKPQGIFVEIVKFCFSFSGWEILVIVTIVMLSELQALTVTIPVGVPSLIDHVCPSLVPVILHAPRGGVCFEEDLELNWQGFSCICLGAVFMIGFRLFVPMVHDRRKKHELV